MTIRPLLSAALALALLAPAGAIGSGEPAAFDSLRVMHAVGTLVSEADGSPSSVHVDTKTTEDLKAAIERTLSRMRFKPVLVGGVPQRVQSAFDISLAARRTADGKAYEVTVDGVEFHPVAGVKEITPDGSRSFDLAVDGRMKPPRYPQEAERAAVMGRVLLALHFTPDGRVDDAAVVKSMLYDARSPSEAFGRRYLNQFEQAALDASRSWRTKFVPGTKKAPDPAGYTAMTAVVFTMNHNNLETDGVWLPVRRLPDRQIPWRKELPAVEINDGGASAGLVALNAGGLELAHPAKGTPVL